MGICCVNTSNDEVGKSNINNSCDIVGKSKVNISDDIVSKDSVNTINGYNYIVGKSNVHHK